MKVPAFIARWNWAMPSVRGVAAVSCVLFSAGASFAGDAGVAGHSTAQAFLANNASFDSNPMMSTREASSLWGTTLSPELQYNAVTPLSKASFDARVDRGIFNQSAYNSTDLHANAQASRQNQRWMAGLQVSGDYDTTRTSELTNYGIETVPSRHWSGTFAPSFSFSPTALDTFGVGGSVSTSRYESSDYVNSDTYMLRPFYNRKLDARDTGIFSLQFQRYQAAHNSQQVDSVTPNVGVHREVSQRFSADASVGLRVSRDYVYGDAVTSWAVSPVFDGGFSFNGLVDTVKFTATRSESSYGNGADAVQTAFSVVDTHVVNPKLSLNGAVSYSVSDYERKDVGNLEERTSLQAGLSYRVTQTVDLRAGYSFTYETLVGVSDPAVGHSLTFNFVVHPKMWTIFR